MYSGGWSVTPLEALSFLMGLQDWAVAIYKECVKELCDFMLDGLIASGIVTKAVRNKTVAVQLIRVSPLFMRRNVFEELVFPHLKKIIDENVKKALFRCFI